MGIQLKATGLMEPWRKLAEGKAKKWPEDFEPKKLILTIDDAPSPCFADVLDYLVRQDIGAIFFVIGCNVRGHERELARAIKEGFVVGNHSYSHPHFDEISAEAARAEITRTDGIINKIYRLSGVRRKNRYFRFPHGRGGTPKTEKENQKVLAELGYSAPRFAPKRDWYWDIPLLEDWHLDESNLYDKKKTVKSYLTVFSPTSQYLSGKKDAVIVVHDIEPNMKLGLFEWIIAEARSHGFSFYNRKELAAIMGEISWS